MPIPNKSRMPVPMDVTRLLAYRWKTPLAIPRKVKLNQRVGPTKIYMGLTRASHQFAKRVGIHAAIAQPVWGYGLTPNTISSPGPSLEALAGAPVSVEWINKLPADHPFTHPLPDLCAGGMASMGRYRTGSGVVHMHGAHVQWSSDGYPIRVPHAMQVGMGPASNPPLRKSVLRSGQSEIFEYPNTQPGAATLWYHDHTMDATAKNVYAGLAGAYLLRHPLERTLPSLPKNNYEVPLILQDRSFAADGALLYADAVFLDHALQERVTNQALQAAGQPIVRTRPDNLNGRPIPMGEFKGQALCVNGIVWPQLIVEPRPYRFRIVNGANSRMFVLRISGELALGVPDVANPATTLVMHQIGADAGIFSHAVPLAGNLTAGAPTTDQFLVLAPGERADVVIDFSVHRNKRLYLTNHAIEAAPLGNAGDAALAPDASATPLQGTEAVMQLKVLPVALSGAWSRWTIADLNAQLPRLASPAPAMVSPARATRSYAVLEFFPPFTQSDAVAAMPPPGRRPWAAITLQPDLTQPELPGFLWAGKPPAVGGVPAGGPLIEADDAPASPVRHIINGQVECWDFFNISGDTHPIHLHLCSFQVLERVPIAGAGTVNPLSEIGPSQVPDPNERGWKDTVRANPNEKLSLLVRFHDEADSTRNYSGHFVWHCHLIEHEDMGMMRPLEIHSI